MMTEAMRIAKDALESLNGDIAASEANLRVMEGFDPQQAVTIRGNLARAKERRAKLLRSIEMEAQRPEPPDTGIES